MCGICGIVRFDGNPVKKDRLESMTRSMIHRGPDDEGFFYQSNAVGFGFRRLSIIDVAGGHQPMRYREKTIVFNGEIYNFKSLRTECESLGHRFETQSDTEVLLHLYDQFGENCAGKLNGMFAFAIWDEKNQELFAARDHLGIKPFYYFFDDKRFIFGSEISAVFRSGEVPLELDQIAMMDYFSYRFVPSPWTILKRVKKIRPGHWIKIKNGKLIESCYWPLNLSEIQTLGEPMESVEERLAQLLEESVKMQMVSDVPLGAFLSGGVDSSLITALMARNSKEKIQTFSIGFDQSTGVDESQYARSVAKYLGTDHHELMLTEKDLPRADQLFSAMNEPVADPAILPTAILSQFARKHVKVALTGEGGDELFAGYNRYKSIIYSQFVKSFFPPIQPMAAMIFRQAGRGGCFKAIPDVDTKNWFLLNRDFEPEQLRPLFNGFNEWDSYLVRYSESLSAGWGDPLNAVLDLERRTALVDRLLMKVDMASMGQSLEARPPYLDFRLVTLALSIPSRYKIKSFKGKYLLRHLAQRFLPSEICWRRKHGFIVPLSQWMKSDSGEWVRAVLEDPAIESLGIFDKKFIQKKLEKIYNNKNMNSLVMLWPAIVLSCWLRTLKNES